VQAGQALLTLVQLDDPWVVANYKESQLTHVEPGQKVTFTVDTYPGVTFNGWVESIMAGTGSAFALLPPENATGNYVKVVQRIPVKILIDRASDPQHLLRVGMSVVPTIYTGRSLGDIIGHLNPF
jgi:membrane fusion protein (multidrug efflux system)